jgi:hypothetical protein
MKTFIVILIIIILIIAALYIFYLKVYLPKRGNLLIKKERIDKLTFNYIREYFQEEKMIDKDYVPVLIKMAQDNPYNVQKETDVEFYTLSFFHKEKQTVLTEKTLIVITKGIDSNLSDALNGKNLLIFENL